MSARSGERVEIPAHLKSRPEARAIPVEDLVRDALRGRLRIPAFQRALNWDVADVQKLFDSIYRGYPVGTLLMWKRRAPAERVTLGSVEVVAPEVADAWWVVDGQQRLTSLVAGMSRPSASAAGDLRWEVWFDPIERRFVGPSKRPERAVPAWVLGDSAGLMRWLLAWEHRAEGELVEVVLEASKRLREYHIPVYIVETDDESVLREIFNRVNTSGRPLNERDVFNALVGTRKEAPIQLDELAQGLGGMGWGKLTPEQLYRMALAVAGRDVTRKGLDFKDAHELEELRDAGLRLDEIAQRVVAFLRGPCNIAHASLLPYPVPLIVLARFFALHPTPNARTRTLLTRWVWRGMLSGVHAHAQRTALRDAVKAIEAAGHEELNAQRLLRFTPRERPLDEWEWSIPDQFRADGARSRVGLCVLGGQPPWDLKALQPLDVRRLLEEHGPDAIRHIQRRPLTAELAHTLANWTLQPPGVPILPRLKALARESPTHPALVSHGIDAAGALALLGDDLAGFFRARWQVLDDLVWERGGVLAAWEANDRPSLDFLLAAGEADDEG